MAKWLGEVFPLLGPPFLVSMVASMLVDAPLRCYGAPMLAVVTSCVFGGIMVVLTDETATMPNEEGVGRILIVGLLAFGLAPFFWGASHLGWNAGTIAASYFEGLNADRRCPVEVSRNWFDETRQLLESNDPLGIRD